MTWAQVYSWTQEWLMNTYSGLVKNKVTIIIYIIYFKYIDSVNGFVFHGFTVKCWTLCTVPLHLLMLYVYSVLHIFIHLLVCPYEIFSFKMFPLTSMLLDKKDWCLNGCCLWTLPIHPHLLIQYDLNIDLFSDIDLYWQDCH